MVRSDRRNTWRASTSDKTATTGRGGASTPEDPRRPSSSDRKKEAELFLDAIRGDLAHGRYVDPAGGLIPFRDYAEQWRLGQVHRPSTAAQAESYLRLHAYPFLGHRPLGSIRRSEVHLCRGSPHTP